jgi:hypothetical protein
MHSSHGGVQLLRNAAESALLLSRTIETAKLMRRHI